MLCIISAAKDGDIEKVIMEVLNEQYAVFSDYLEQPYLATVPNNWSGGKK